MLSKKDAKLIASLTVLSSILLAALPSLADTKYVSKDGNLTIQYIGKKCFTTKPTGIYRVRNGSGGELTAITCEGMDGDAFPYKFQDTSGKERCYGRMSHAWSQKVYTIWEIQGAVSGYPCSQTGKTFTVEMDSGRQI